MYWEKTNELYPCFGFLIDKHNILFGLYDHYYINIDCTGTKRNQPWVPKMYLNTT